MKKNKVAFMMLSIVVAIGVFSFSEKKEPVNELKKLPGTVILDWNETAFKAFGGPAYQHSLMAARINAMTHIAMHDAVNAVYPTYKVYAFTGRDAKANAIAAAASAAYTVLLREIPSKKEMLDSALQSSLVSIKDREARQRGIKLGRLAAETILNHRRNDGAAHDPIGQISSSAKAGVYQPVPPFNIVFAPQWENVKLFALKNKAQFRPAPNPALNSEAYTVGFNEVKEIGKKDSKVRNADQTFYAKFWYEFSEAGWNRVARVAATDKNLNLPETARLFALVDMALADSYTAGWDAKFYYNFWRPYTAIRNAGNDGNEKTSADKEWLPSEPTPPVHDYPSTHSALGNAAATVLARLLGDNTAFTMTSFTAMPQGATRSFKSFSQAADENADSRVMAGIHFRFSCKAGQELGSKIGNWVVDNKLQPLK